MKRYFFFVLLCMYIVPAYGQEKIIPVVIDGDEVSYLREEQKVSAKGNVVMKYQDLTLYCDEALYDASNNTATIQGNVKIVGSTGTVTTESADYDFATQRARISSIRIELLPQEKAPALFARAQEGEKTGENEYILHNGYITTDDLHDPHYRLTSKRITIYPGEKVVAKHMVLRIGAVPVMYLPYYSQSLNDRSFPFEVSPGKNKDWGLYALTRWRYNIDDKNKGKVLFDVYEDRGIGRGVTHAFETKKYGKGIINLYYIDDKQYREKPAGSADLPDRDRYRGQLSYFNRVNDRFSVRAEYYRTSDKDFRKDFFEREYDVDPEPLTYLMADYAFNNSSLTLLTQKRVNPFFTETEYLPKLEYNFFRQPVMSGSPFYFESNTFAGYTTRRFADGMATPDQEAMRFHSHNIFSFQKKYGWLFVNPFAGNYTTYYSRNAFGESDIIREAPEAGATLSTKLYKTVGSDFSLLGQDIETMRHVFTPSVTYHYIHAPTASNDVIYQFDADDDLERKESIVVTLENKLQARNEERVWDFLYFAPSLEYKIHQEGKGSHLDTINADLEIYPARGISIDAESVYDAVDSAFREANVDFGIRDEENDTYSFQFGHRYARDESSQSTLSWRYQINPRLEFRNYLRYEYTTGDFKEQQYVLRRDLHSWYMDFGLNVDESSNMTFWVVFTLKGFPDIHFGFENTYEGARESY